MEKTFRNHGRLAVQLSLLLAAASALAADVNCIDYTPGPAECCTLSTQSAGSGAEYTWYITMGPGYIEPFVTGYPWTAFHCYETDFGMAWIVVYVDDDNDWGDGAANCHQY